MSVNTWHSEEQSFLGAAVCLDVFTVVGPVQVRDEAARTGTLTHFLIQLSARVDVHEVIIAAHCQMFAIRRVLHLVDYFFAVFDVNHFG